MQSPCQIEEAESERAKQPLVAISGSLCWITVAKSADLPKPQSTIANNPCNADFNLRKVGHKLKVSTGNQLPLLVLFHLATAVARPFFGLLFRRF